jgi:hypothetical protein
MATQKPTVTGTTHTLPFKILDPRAFERMCMWVIEREGYERAEHLGLAGSEQGRDVIACKSTSRGEELWYFQCKRYISIGTSTLRRKGGKTAFQRKLLRYQAELRRLGLKVKLQRPART